MELKITEDQIKQYSLYENRYLYWNIGFHYYINKYELQNRPEYHNPTSVYLNETSITHEIETKGEKRTKVLTKLNIVNKGKRIFKKIRAKLKDKTCEIWCSQRDYLSVLPGFMTDGLLNHEYPKLIEAIQWIFSHFNVPAIHIPELAFLLSSGVAIAALFIKINKDFDKMCNCESRKKESFEKSLEVITKGISGPIKKVKPFRLKGQSNQGNVKKPSD